MQSDCDTNSDLQFRSYAPGDERAIEELFLRSYGRSLPSGLWPWRFRENPAAHAIIDLAWAGDTLAAHYAVSPVVLSVAGRDAASALSGTTMTHPDYRGRGLFPLVATRTYDRMAQDGMVMVWGFPNTNSHRGFIRDLRWTDICEVPTFRLRLDNARASASTQEVVELSEFDGRLDGLWRRLRDRYHVIVKRDRRYLEWRYHRHPTERYRILVVATGDSIDGYCVFKRYQREMQVVDILTTDVGTGERLMLRAAEIAAQAGCAAVSMWLNVTDPLHRALEKVGFRNGEPVTYFGGLLLPPGSGLTALYDYRNWHLMMGDSDVY